MLVERLFTPAGGGALSAHPAGALVYGTLRDEQGRGRWINALPPTPKPPELYRRGHGGASMPRLPRGADRGAGGAVRAGCAAGEGGANLPAVAFLNGRMDPTPAEAVIDLIDAETPAAARCAAGRLGGAMSRKIGAIYDELVTLMAHFDVVLDYSDSRIWSPLTRRRSPRRWAVRRKSCAGWPPPPPGAAAL